MTAAIKVKTKPFDFWHNVPEVIFLLYGEGAHNVQTIITE